MKPLLIGVTGCVGGGKSTLSALLEMRGWVVVDTDQLARTLVEPTGAAYPLVRSAFGADYFLPDGHLDRSKMAETVFSCQASRTRLEKILHPMIQKEWEAQAKKGLHSGLSVAVVIPLIFESGMASEMDQILCVGCSPQIQQERLLARGWSEDQIQKRIAAQWPLERKIQSSQKIIWNDGPLPLLAEQLDLWLAREGC